MVPGLHRKDGGDLVAGARGWCRRRAGLVAGARSSSHRRGVVPLGFDQKPSRMRGHSVGGKWGVDRAGRSTAGVGQPEHRVDRASYSLLCEPAS